MAHPFSSNRTQRSIIVYEEMQGKKKIVDEVYFSINDRISVRMIRVFYNRNWSDVIVLLRLRACLSHRG